MADEVFALSPISARGALPTETDYEAIREAFMETARGRWFLGEYAKRNRNSDTTVVLEAVSRLEQIVALHKQTPPPAIDGVSDAVDAILQIVDSARKSIDAALGSSFLDEALAPSRRSARIIQEIAWSLRESGADSRISNILDGQVGAINAACESLAAFNVRDEVLKTFDDARQKIEQVAGPRPETVVVEREAAPADPELSKPVSLVSSALPMDLQPETLETPIETTMPTPVVLYPAPPADVVVEPAPIVEPENSVEPVNSVEPESVFEAAIAETHVEPSFSQQPISQTPVTPPAVLPPAVSAAAVSPPPDSLPTASPPPDAASPGSQKRLFPPLLSFGESLIARGIIPKPVANAPDPLAPFQRMTQAEKIAFFS